MHVRWKRKQHKTNRVTGESLCDHCTERPWTLTPVMMLYREGRYKSVWRIGPGIRECCLDQEHARAAWWWEIDQRFDDLETEGLDPELTQSILGQRSDIEDLLAAKVAQPTERARQEYIRFRKELGLKRRGRSPGF